MLTCTEMLLTNHNRPKRKLNKLKGIVIHWTANKSVGANAVANRNFFNSTPNAVSAHYIVDDKQIIQCMPDDEVAYHVGAKQYTETGKSIREGSYSPNYYLIGIEMCVNADGNWLKTYMQSVELSAYLIQKYGLTIKDLYRHYDITGKLCPQMMIDETAWKKFKSDVLAYLSTYLKPNTPQPVKITVDGELIDINTIIQNSTTYVPIRPFATALGAAVDWDGNTKTVIVTTKGR